MDDMFFSPDERSLRRGRRVARRTPTCRPCVVWTADEPELRFHGVVLDVSPYGMLIRMLEPVPPETPVLIQLMRDDQFQRPLSAPVSGRIIRHAGAVGEFTDHGVRLEVPEISRVEARPVRTVRPAAAPPRTRPRMHTIDLRVGDRSPRKRR